MASSANAVKEGGWRISALSMGASEAACEGINERGKTWGEVTRACPNISANWALVASVLCGARVRMVFVSNYILLEPLSKAQVD